MDTRELDYDLPSEAIAQEPITPRDAARLLVDHGPGASPAHRHVRDLPDLLGPGDLVVVNDTRVIPARLRLRKPTGGWVEVLVLERRPDGWWEALVRPGRKVVPGSVVAREGFEVEIGAHLRDGRRLVRLRVDDEAAALEAHGELPLPPYVTRRLEDPGRYQTVFGSRPGSTAAPTAGLHLTESLIDRLEGRGVRIAHVELAIGPDTFRPIRSDTVADHPMHSERYRVPATTWEACRRAGRVVAVGTTVVRSLETAARTGDLEGRTDLFIHGDDDFLAVDALLTNFHLPRSTLLALIDAFVGPRWRELYETALAAGYRFLSFGDAMFLPARTRPRPAPARVADARGGVPAR